MSVENWTGRVICDAPSPACHATVSVGVDEGGYSPIDGALRCESCGKDICASHALKAKDGVCAECLDYKAPLSYDEALAFARALLELDPLSPPYRVASMALMRLCPHPPEHRAKYVGIRIECSVCGIFLDGSKPMVRS